MGTLEDDPSRVDRVSTEATRRATRWSHTIAAVRSAFSRVAEAWIFQPWAGPAAGFVARP